MADIRNLDLNLLRALDALLDTRSVTLAAQRLALTQPTVSGMLARLREAFDDPLFIRVQRGILPTPRAEALTEPLKAALREIEALLEPTAFDPALAERTISIAATDYAQRVVLLPLIAKLRVEAPGIRVAIRPVEQQRLLPLMEQGQLDMALITPEMASDQLRARRLFDEEYVCVLRKGHPAAAVPLDLDAFCALDHAIMSHDGTQFRGATDLALETLGRRRRVVIAAPSFIFLVDLIKGSDICALVPARLVREIEGLTQLPPPLSVPGFTKVLVWHERSHHDAASIWVRQRIAGKA